MSFSAKFDTIKGPFLNQEIVTATIGPSLVGALFNLIFFGVAASQVYEYFTSSHFKRDTWKVKSVVLSVLALATIQSSFEFWLVYRYGCTQDRGLVDFFTKTIIDDIATLVVGIEGAIVQSFLTIRAALLFSSHRARVIFYVVAASAIGSGFLGSVIFWTVSLMTRAGYGQSALPLTTVNATLVWLSGAACADIIVTACLCYNLRKRIAGFENSTDSVLRALIKIAIASASYTAVTATIPVILTLSSKIYTPVSNAAYFFPVPLSSLYLLSLLLNLNSREKIRAIATGTTSKYNHSQHFGNHSHIRSFNDNSLRTNEQPLHISYRTEKHVLTEDAKGTIHDEIEF